VEPANFAVNFAKTSAYLALVLATSPHVPAQPALAPYVHA